MDTIQIEVQAGKGGNGCISYERLSPARKKVFLIIINRLLCITGNPSLSSKPSGGNGGRGGHVFVVAKDKFGMNGLNFSTIHFNAEDGSHGGSTTFAFQTLFVSQYFKLFICLFLRFLGQVPSSLVGMELIFISAFLWVPL